MFISEPRTLYQPGCISDVFSTLPLNKKQSVHKGTGGYTEIKEETLSWSRYLEAQYFCQASKKGFKGYTYRFLTDAPTTVIP